MPVYMITLVYNRYGILILIQGLRGVGCLCTCRKSTQDLEKLSADF